MKKILGFVLTLTIGFHVTMHAVVSFDQHGLAAVAACYVQTQREAGFSDEQILREVLTKVEASKALIEEAPVTLRTTEDNQQRILYFVAGVGSTIIAMGLVYYIIELLQEKPEDDKLKFPVPGQPTTSHNGTASENEIGATGSQSIGSRNVGGVRSKSSGDDQGNSANNPSDNDDDYDTEPCPDSDAHGNPPVSKKDLEAKKKENAKQLVDEAVVAKERSDFAKMADRKLPGSDAISSAPEASVPSYSAERDSSWGPYLVINNQDDHQIDIEFSL